MTKCILPQFPVKLFIFILFVVVVLLTFVNVARRVENVFMFLWDSTLRNDRKLPSRTPANWVIYRSYIKYSNNSITFNALKHMH